MIATGDPREFLTKDINVRNLASERLPILVIEAADETPEAGERPLPPIWHLSLDVTIYTRLDASHGGDGTDQDPDAVLDPLLAHLEAALERVAGEDRSSWWTTLGGLCSRAFPSGTGHRYQDEAGNVWATMPVEIVAPTGARGNPAP